MGFERRPAGPSVERQAPSIGRGRRFAGLEEGCPAAMLDSGHPFCDGGAWLGRRVRVGSVDEGLMWMWRGYSWGAVASAVEFADADQMPLAADGAAGDVDPGEAQDALGRALVIRRRSWRLRHGDRQTVTFL